MNNKLLLQGPIRSAIKAANDHDTNSFLSNFVETAVLTDEGQQYEGIRAIRKWTVEKLVGANVTFDVINFESRGDTSVVTAKVNGDFDKTGLPDPFVMALHFVISGSKIEYLSFRLPQK